MRRKPQFAVHKTSLYAWRDHLSLFLKKEEKKKRKKLKTLGYFLKDVKQQEQEISSH